MCGFITTASSTQPFSPELIRKSIQSLHHRGPDESGMWQNENSTVNFGHARLSIIDLSTGTQPMTNGDNSLVAVVNGEFYDYKRIRRELQDTGYVFKTQSDSEILLALYERYGTQCLKELRGEFAFVLWDKRNQWVFAARDRFGIKPLFYTIHKNTLYCASEVKALKALGVPMRWDEDGFFQALCMMQLPNTTLFEGIKQIPPGHYMVKSLHSNDVHIQSYWDFNYPKMGERPAFTNEREAIEDTRRLLIESVQLRLQADVPVACYLSGGLDSCSLLGIAQSLSKSPVAAFTLTFSDQHYDEAVQAEEMAKFVGTHYHPVPISQAKIAEGMEDALWHAERFFLNGHGVAKYFLSEATRDAGYKVVLTGEGSDEIFAGYSHFRQDKILYDESLNSTERAAAFHALAESNTVSQGMLLAAHPGEDTLKIRQLLGYTPSWAQAFSSQMETCLHVLESATQKKYENRNPAHFFLNTLDISGQLQGREKLDQSLYTWSKMTLPYYLLTVLGDRMEMAHSIEGRVPFLDHKFVEHVVKLPPHMKIHKQTEKYILREAAKPFITRTIYERQKHPFLTPPALSVEGDSKLREFIQDNVRSSRVPFLNHSAVVQLLDSTLKGDIRQQKSLDIFFMILASASILQRKFEL